MTFEQRRFVGDDSVRGMSAFSGRDHVVGVDVLAGSDGLRGDSDELAEFENAIAGSEGDECDLVAGGNFGCGGEGVVERGVRGDGLACDGDIVAGMEMDELGGNAHSTRVAIRQRAG